MTMIDFQTAMQRAKQAGGGEPLPDGPYAVVVIEATPSVSSTQKPMIKAKYQVEVGPHAGRKIFDQFVFSADNDNALSFFFQHMGFFGLDEAFFAQSPSWEQVAATLMGRRITVELGMRMWDGQMRNEVKKYRPAGAGMDAGTMVPGAIPGYAPPAAQAPGPMDNVIPMPGMPQPAMPAAAAPAPMTPPAAPPMPPAAPPMPPLQQQPPAAPMPPAPPVPPAPQPAPPVPAPVQAAPPVPQPMAPPVPQAPPMPAAPPAAPPVQYEVPQVAQQPVPAPVTPQVAPMPQMPMPPQPAPQQEYVPTPEQPV
jgi:hypothetical protein